MQVITAAEFHPHQCHVFAYSSSKGSVRLADQRASALCERHAKAFTVPEPMVRSHCADSRQQSTLLYALMQYCEIMQTL